MFQGEKLGRPFLRYQPEPELLPHRRHDSRTSEIGRSVRALIPTGTVPCPIQREIIVARQPCLVDNRVANLSRQEPGQTRYGNILENHLPSRAALNHSALTRWWHAVLTLVPSEFW